MKINRWLTRKNCWKITKLKLKVFEKTGHVANSQGQDFQAEEEFLAKFRMTNLSKMKQERQKDFGAIRKYKKEICLSSNNVIGF